MIRRFIVENNTNGIISRLPIIIEGNNENEVNCKLVDYLACNEKIIE